MDGREGPAAPTTAVMEAGASSDEREGPVTPTTATADGMSAGMIAALVVGVSAAAGFVGGSVVLARRIRARR